MSDDRCSRTCVVRFRVLVMPGRLNVIPSGCLLEKFKSKRPNSDERLGAVIAIRVASFPVNISKDKFSLAGKDLI